ncbi:prepilin peptidase, partial [Lactobacillus sp. XV13L]|nr:prepilin peptidase [Lactobacillus sp. XV13L]
VNEMTQLYCLTNFFIGACLASHAAVIAARIDREDFIFSRSHCQACRTELSLLDELPIVSYFWLHGRCRYCHAPIPATLPVIETVGGFAYARVDFSGRDGIALAILLFSLLITAISDHEHREFHVSMLLPAAGLALSRSSKILRYQLLDLFELLPVVVILVCYVCRGKMGTGDLIIYLILAIYFSPAFANRIFLLAALFLLVHFLLERKNRRAQDEIAFVPYIFLGLTVLLLA